MDLFFCLNKKHCKCGCQSQRLRRELHSGVQHIDLISPGFFNGSMDAIRQRKRRTNHLSRSFYSWSALHGRNALGLLTPTHLSNGWSCFVRYLFKFNIRVIVSKLIGLFLKSWSVSPEGCVHDRCLSNIVALLAGQQWVYLPSQITLLTHLIHCFPWVGGCALVWANKCALCTLLPEQLIRRLLQWLHSRVCESVCDVLVSVLNVCVF